MFLPTIRAVSENLPDSEITVLVRNKPVKELLDLAKLPGNVSVEYPQLNSWRFKQTFNPLGNLLRLNLLNFWTFHKIRKIKPDVSVAMTKMNPRLTPLMLKISGSKITIGERLGWGQYLYYNSMRTDLSKHRVIRNLSLLKALSISATEQPDINLYPLQKDIKYTAQIINKENNGKYIKMAVAPCVTLGQKWRLWPENHWAGLFDSLSEHFNIKFFLLGGLSKEDRQITSKIIKKVKNKNSVSSLAGKLSIKQTAAFISLMDYICGIDCGLLHIAASVGTEIIAIWAATQTDHYPFTDKKHIIQLPCKCRGNYPKSIKKSCRETPECLYNFTAKKAFADISNILTDYND